MYNYLEELKKDIVQHLEEGWEYRYLGTAEDLEELEEQLNENLWTCDSVTGNASGSYTFNSLQAREYVIDNIDLLREAFEEYGEEAGRVAKLFLEEDWEAMDVIIRCYLLSQAIAEIIEEYAEELEEVFSEASED